MYIDDIMHKVNIRSNIVENLFVSSYSNNNAYLGLNTIDRDKYNCELIRDYEYEFLIVTTRDITKGEELSMDHHAILNHFKLKPIKGSVILNKISAIFFKCRKDIIEELIKMHKNKNFP